MSCPPPRPPKVPFTVTSAEPEAAPAKSECELDHSICVQCGTGMNLIKTKWICPKCKWIIGCCD